MRFVELDEVTVERIEQAAKQRGVSPEDLVRQALAASGIIPRRGVNTCAAEREGGYGEEPSTV